MSLFRLFAAGLAVLALGGCYISKTAVIDQQMAVAVPDLEGRYMPASDEADPTVIEITTVAGSNDYSYVQKDEEGEDSLVLRAIPLREGLYIGQLTDATGESPEAILIFVEMRNDGVAITVPQGDTAALAQQYGVTLNTEEYTVEGDPAAIIAFLEAHADVEMSPPELVLARAP